jgi:hypothetical protein
MTITDSDVVRLHDSLVNAPVVLLDPAEILTDPDTYQFRGCYNKAGVTKGHSRETWDTILDSDPLLVHKKLDGKIFVADGHHRLNRAKHCNATGKGPGKILALELREADGFSAQDVKIIAAFRNMAQGHTSLIDAAKVFREAHNIDIDKLPPLRLEGDLNIAYSMSWLPDAVFQEVITAPGFADRILTDRAQQKRMGVSLN